MRIARHKSAKVVTGFAAQWRFTTVVTFLPVQLDKTISAVGIQTGPGVLGIVRARVCIVVIGIITFFTGCRIDITIAANGKFTPDHTIAVGVVAGGCILRSFITLFASSLADLMESIAAVGEHT